MITPGEWEVKHIPIIYQDDPHKQTFKWSVVCGDMLVADCGTGLIDQGDNARLIAASPRMYEALRTILSYELDLPQAVIKQAWASIES